MEWKARSTLYLTREKLEITNDWHQFKPIGESYELLTSEVHNSLSYQFRDPGLEIRPCPRAGDGKKAITMTMAEIIMGLLYGLKKGEVMVFRRRSRGLLLTLSRYKVG